MGLVHRDFKPSNVFVDRQGRPKVGDFGLVSAHDAPPSDDAEASWSPPGADVSLTRTGEIFGTPGYMAPEQLAGETADARADQFAFCVALHEALYGARPFAGSTPLELHRAIAGGPPTGAPRARAVPSWLRAVVTRGLRAAPDDRYASMRELLTELRRDPDKARRRLAFAAGAAALLVVGAVGVRAARPVDPPPCSGASARLSGVWDASRKGAVERAFLATGVAFAPGAVRGVQEALDAYSAGWVAMETDACMATRVRGEQSEEALDLRMQCLSRGRTELGALVDHLAQADARAVERSVVAARDLPELATCANVPLLKAPVRPPSDAATRAQTDAIDARLSEVKVLRETGKWGPGIEAAERAAGDARQLGYRPLEARALLELGRAHGANGEWKVAEKGLRDALYAAFAGHDDEVAASALVELVRVVGVAQDRFDEAREITREAVAVIERIGGSERLRAELEVWTANILLSEHRYDDARAKLDEAIPLVERAMGPTAVRLATAHNARGLAFTSLGKHAEAIADFEQARAIFERAVGPEHPYVIDPIGNMSNVYALEHDYERALHYDELTVHLAEVAVGTKHTRYGAQLGHLCNSHIALHRYDEAVAECSRAMRIYEDALGPTHPSLGFQLLGLGQAYLGAGHPELALPPLERALELRTTHATDPMELAETELTVARALPRAPATRVRARALATKARDAFARGGEDAKESLDAADAFLRAR
jgi:tetratricopeptide (TPR) repeat protein